MKARTSAVALILVAISAAVAAAQQPIQSGFGQGAYREDSGVTPPVVIKEVRPNYTSDAMRAKIQGRVELEAVVLPNGTVGDVRVVRSLDAQFGLDQEAMFAARKWLFRPGLVGGKFVPTVVTLVLEFRLSSGPAPQDPFALALQPGATPSGKVSDPKLLREIRPTYTEAALRAKIEGLVELEAIVEPDGTIKHVRVAKSLDNTFGLDQQAIAAAKQWQFEPGLLNGQAVPVLVTLILEFRLSRAPGSEQTPVPQPDPFLEGVTKTGVQGAVEPKLFSSFPRTTPGRRCRRRFRASSRLRRW